MSPDRKLSDVTMLRKFKEGDAFVSCRFILYDRNKISIGAKGDLDLICLRKIFLLLLFRRSHKENKYFIN